MEKIFLTLLNRSIAAGWLILAVLILRLLLKRAPRWIICALWALVAMKLVCPFSIESALSLIPSAETFDSYNIQYERPEVNTGIDRLDSAVNPVLEDTFVPETDTGVSPLYAWTEIAGILWAVGAAGLLFYAGISSLFLHRRIRESALLRENIWVGDAVWSPFILGILRPRVYLPSGLEEACRESVIAHERAHLARRDHWWKALGFLLLAICWFQPLCWIAYILLCRDIERACDEKVIRRMEPADRKAYSYALLACGARRRPVLVCPLAFAEVGVKERVKNVLNYRKPAARILAASAVVCAAAAICFLTDPIAEANASYMKLTEEGGPFGWYTLRTGEGIPEGRLVVESWTDGQRKELGSVELTGQTGEIQICLESEVKSGTTEMNVQITSEALASGMEKYSASVNAPAVFMMEKAMMKTDKKISVSSGESQTVAVWSADLIGNGVEAFDVTEEYYRQAQFVLVVRAEFS